MLGTVTDEPQLPRLGEPVLRENLLSTRATAIGGDREPWVTAAKAAEFLSVAQRRVLAEVRAGRLPGHPFPGKQRRTWLFLLSELDAYMRAQTAPSTISAAAPASRRRKSNGKQGN